ncbi:MAG: polymerase sigma factor SigW [Planctomycetota bacterium]|jgi:RNA polymerase sigma-70 factor (ECF subfamily)
MAKSSSSQDIALKSDDIERFRPYLRVLAQTRFQTKFQSKLDASDIVQQTMLNAYQSWEQFRGKSDAELAGWLRQILANLIIRNTRDMGRGKRDVQRERSIDAELQQSSMRLGKLLADPGQVTPSQMVMKEERAAVLARALMELPDDQREAILGKYWHGQSSAEIGEQLQRSPEAVAGLLYRGLKKLREVMGQATP